jgi:hypothetical protein
VIDGATNTGVTITDPNVIGLPSVVPGASSSGRPR